jgi:hypothetical protein
MVLVIAFLHANDVVLGPGIRPSRWILDDRHFLQLINLGVATTYDIIHEQAPSISKYLAPHLLNNPLSKHPLDDWHSLGLILLEMYGERKPSDLAELLLSRTVRSPSQVMGHPFFAGVHWIRTYERNVLVPGPIPKMKAKKVKAGSTVQVQSEIPTVLKRSLDKARGGGQGDDDPLVLTTEEIVRHHAIKLPARDFLTPERPRRHIPKAKSPELLEYIAKRQEKEVKERQASHERRPPFMMTHKFTVRESPERISKSKSRERHGGASPPAPHHGYDESQWKDADDDDLPEEVFDDASSASIVSFIDADEELGDDGRVSPVPNVAAVWGHHHHQARGDAAEVIDVLDTDDEDDDNFY